MKRGFKHGNNLDWTSKSIPPLKKPSLQYPKALYLVHWDGYLGWWHGMLTKWTNPMSKECTRWSCYFNQLLSTILCPCAHMKWALVWRCPRFPKTCHLFCIMCKSSNVISINIAIYNIHICITQQCFMKIVDNFHILWVLRWNFVNNFESCNKHFHNCYNVKCMEFSFFLLLFFFFSSDEYCWSFHQLRL